MQLYFLLLAFVAVLSENIYVDDGDCGPRIRRPLTTLSQSEVMLYVSGLQSLRENGKFEIMSNAHAHHTTIHAGSSFFFYHTYFVWEVETQIRALGGKYRCFTLPYYDFTVDADAEIPSVLQSVFGGDGDPDNNLCVTGTMWSVERWPLYEEVLCAEDEDPEQGCCLKRHVGQDLVIADADKMGDVIAEHDDFLDFLTQIAFEHQQVHWLFAKEGCTICAMATGRSPEDPIFMLLHSFVAYLRALWASCYGYNLIAADALDEHPEVYTAQCRLDVGPGNCDVIELDDAYVFDKMSVEPWSIVSSIDVTPRMLWDFSDWGVQYEIGEFYVKSGLADKCPVKNFLKGNDWFYLNQADDAAPATPGDIPAPAGDDDQQLPAPDQPRIVAAVEQPAPGDAADVQQSGDVAAVPEPVPGEAAEEKPDDVAVVPEPAPKPEPVPADAAGEEKPEAVAAVPEPQQPVPGDAASVQKPAPVKKASPSDTEGFDVALGPDEEDKPMPPPKKEGGGQLAAPKKPVPGDDQKLPLPQEPVQDDDDIDGVDDQQLPPPQDPEPVEEDGGNQTIEESDAAVDEDDAVVDKDDADVDEDDAVVDEDDAAVDEDDAVVDEDDAVVDEDDAVVDDGDEDDAVVDEDDAVVDEDGAAVDEDGAAVDEDDAAVDEDDAAVDEDGAAVDEDGAAVDEDEDDAVVDEDDAVVDEEHSVNGAKDEEDEDAAEDDVDDEGTPQHQPRQRKHYDTAGDEDDEYSGLEGDEAFVQMESLRDGAIKRPSMSVNVAITMVVLAAVFLFGAIMWFKSSRQEERKKLTGEDKGYKYTLIASSKKSNYGTLSA